MSTNGTTIITVRGAVYQVDIIDTKTGKVIDAPETAAKVAKWAPGLIEEQNKNHRDTIDSIYLTDKRIEVDLRLGGKKSTTNTNSAAIAEVHRDRVREKDRDVFLDKKDGKHMFTAKVKAAKDASLTEPRFRTYGKGNRKATDVLSSYSTDQAGKTETKKWNSSGKDLTMKEVFDIEAETTFDPTFATNNQLKQNSFHTSVRYLYNSPANGHLDDKGRVIRRAMTPSSAVGVVNDHLANTRVIGYRENDVEKTDMYASARPQTEAQVEELVSFMVLDQFEKGSYSGITDSPDSNADIEFTFADFSLIHAQYGDKKNFKTEEQIMQALQGKVIEVKVPGQDTPLRVRLKPMMISRSLNLFEHFTPNTASHRKHDKAALNQLKQIALTRSKDDDPAVREKAKKALKLIDDMDKHLTGLTSYKKEAFLLNMTYICNELDIPIWAHCKVGCDRTGLYAQMNIALRQWKQAGLPIPEKDGIPRPDLLFKDDRFKEFVGSTSPLSKRMVENAYGVGVLKWRVNKLLNPSAAHILPRRYFNWLMTDISTGSNGSPNYRAYLIETDKERW